jgi:hypothetical protein
MQLVPTINEQIVVSRIWGEKNQDPISCNGWIWGSLPMDEWNKLDNKKELENGWTKEVWQCLV